MVRPAWFAPSLPQSFERRRIVLRIDAIVNRAPPSLAVALAIAADPPLVDA